SGSVCQAAQCVPPTDPNNPATGLNCSLAVTGAGPLGNPTGAPSQDDQVVSYPSIAAIPSGGFAIAYREVAQGGILSRFTSFPIDKNGGAYPIQIFGLDNCGVLDDGVGLAFGPSNGGISAYSKPCISTQETETIPNGVVFAALDSETKKSAINLAACKGCADPLNVQVSNRSVVWSEARKSFLTVLTQEGQATLSERLPEATVGTREGVVLPFGGTAKDHISASISVSPGSTELVGLLATSKVPYSNDDSGAPVGTLYANLVNSTQLSSIGSAYRIPGSWGSVAVAGTRLLVLAGDGEGGITVRALDPDVASPDRLRQTFLDTEALGNIAGSVVRAEIAVLGDRFFVAMEIESIERGKRTGDIVVAAYDHALPPKTPIRFREVRFSRDPRVPSVERIRDGRLAVTAADNRVAVVWATGRELTSNDRVGGYATLACD
ncbi:MAG: hypothetical protein KBF88_10785, partial [Polyangiaceae bacterium]|nr:hypothetical protein [Polyangiaceae bacterium]